MRHDSLTRDKPRFDWKAAGYLVSIVSVLLLGAVAWPSPQEPAWMKPVLIAGMATAIVGMGLRYIAHVKETRDIQRARQAARN